MGKDNCHRTVDALYAKIVIFVILLGYDMFFSQPKEKNGGSHFAMAQPSLFFPHFDFTLMNVYMNTEIK